MLVDLARAGNARTADTERHATGAMSIVEAPWKATAASGKVEHSIGEWDRFLEL